MDSQVQSDMTSSSNRTSITAGNENLILKAKYCYISLQRMHILGIAWPLTLYSYITFWSVLVDYIKPGWLFSNELYSIHSFLDMGTLSNLRHGSFGWPIMLVMFCLIGLLIFDLLSTQSRVILICSCIFTFSIQFALLIIVVVRVRKEHSEEVSKIPKFSSSNIQSTIQLTTTALPSLTTVSNQSLTEKQIDKVYGQTLMLSSCLTVVSFGSILLILYTLLESNLVAFKRMRASQEEHRIELTNKTLKNTKSAPSSKHLRSVKTINTATTQPMSVTQTRSHHVHRST